MVTRNAGDKTCEKKRQINKVYDLKDTYSWTWNDNDLISDLNSQNKSESHRESPRPLFRRFSVETHRSRRRDYGKQERIATANSTLLGFQDSLREEPIDRALRELKR